MDQCEAPPFPLFPPVKLFGIQIFEHEQTEWVNWRDFQAAHWLSAINPEMNRGWTGAKLLRFPSFLL